MNQLKLTVKKINSTCDFELSWSNNRALNAQLEYPQHLIDIYEKWRTAYLKYHSTLQDRNLRITAISVIVGFTEPNENWHNLLRDTEYKFKDEFNHWLYSYKLEEIRNKIINLANSDLDDNTQILVTCSTKELTRLPWETWNIGSELGISNQINITRTSINNPLGRRSTVKFRKPRILAIIGYDTNLDFSQDKKNIQSLSKIAHTHFVEHKKNDASYDFVQEVFKTINSPEGWDILFFIGHSNEENLGGEFHLTPNTSLRTENLKNSLTSAAQNGLQLAFFNSCSGIDIAEYLVELGLSQVIVMREPINNQVASTLLEKFVTSLSQLKNVQTSFKNACDYFQQENIQHKYPSAYLIPSLYRHRDAKLFKFIDWQEESKKWLPDKNQIKCLLILLLLSFFPPIQDLLLETRLLTQFLYRQVTKQTYPIKQPPTLLVQIDEESLTKANLPWRSREEIDRSYLAKLINRLSQKSTTPKVIGIDYKLWEPKPPEDTLLKEAIETGIKNNHQLVLAASTREQKTVIPEIVNPQTSLHGDIDLYLGYLELLPTNSNCQIRCPFAYLLSLLNVEQQNYIAATPQLKPVIPEKNKTFLQKLRLSPITSFSQHLSQMWFHPILDFSISPEKIYNPIPAWCLLENESNSTCKATDKLEQQIIIIAPGGYEEADDNFAIPLPLQLTKKMPTPYLTGGELHAYMVHHLNNRHIVIPIPDFMVILLFAILAQGVILHLQPGNRKKWIRILVVSNFTYFLICLQLYIYLKILIPCLLPSVLLWSYMSLSANRRKHEQLSHIL